MAENDSAFSTTQDRDRPVRRRAVRYGVPVAVAGVAAATVGLVPALAASGGPDLPKITAQQLVEKIAASRTTALSGTVTATADLGLPSLGDAALSGAGGVLGGQGSGSPSGVPAPSGGSADPQSRMTELASGTHTLRVAVDGPDRQRLSIVENAAEYSVIHNGDQLWAYDSAGNQAFHTTAPQPTGSGRPAAPEGVPATPAQLAQEVLKAAGPTSSVTVGGTAEVAGRDAYDLVIKPKQAGSTVGSVTIAVDARTGTPLKFTLVPSGGGAPAVDVGFTRVDFARPAASQFDFTAPKGTKVTQGDRASGTRHGATGKAPQGMNPHGMNPHGTEKVLGKGWTTVVELSPAKGAAGGGLPAEAQKLFGSGSKVSGSFGSGTVVGTRLVNALVTDDGTVFVGALDKDALVKAADAAK